MKSTFLTLGALLLLQGCGDGVGKVNDIAFDSVVEIHVENLFDNEKYPSCDLTLNFRFPSEYADTAVLARLQAQFTESCFGEQYNEMPPRDAARSYVDAYLADYEKLEVPYGEDLKMIKERPVGNWYGYVERVSNEVVFNASDIISQRVTTEAYTGGAHGSSRYSNYVFDLVDGSRVTESDIFVAGYRDSLMTMLVNAVMRSVGVAERSDLREKGFFALDNISPNGNFLVDSLGLTYTFNEYEIAAYSVGATDIRFTYVELSDLLLADSPISGLFAW